MPVIAEVKDAIAKCTVLANPGCCTRLRNFIDRHVEIEKYVSLKYFYVCTGTSFDSTFIHVS
jgi:hypothetical protein